MHTASSSPTASSQRSTGARAPWLALSLAVSGLLLAALPARVQAGQGAKWLHLFHVGHDESANVVQYDIVVDETCKPVGEQPIKAYWRLTKKKETRSLTVLERRAYGVRNQKSDGDSVRFHVAARPQQEAHATAVMRNGKCQAELWTNVNGKRAILEKAWIRTSERAWWRLPEVAFVDLFARLSGGESVKERIFP